MTLTLPDRLQEYVRRKVEDGSYASADEVVVEALERMRSDDDPSPQSVEELKAAIQKGRDSIARGDFVVVEDDAAIDAFFDRLNAR